jgi:16S rRNA (uracil1498-N3)-methyltransferase
MKELRYFYDPNPEQGSLPAEEANHVLRVLRLKEGDTINVIDGQGNLHTCTITGTGKHECLFRINNTTHFEQQWSRSVNIAMAPTKNIDRTEWFAEKATEIGVDRIDFIDCRFSERRSIKTERIEKIAVSAMKQSHKVYKPTVEPMQSFKDLVTTPFQGIRCIAHCYDDKDLLLPDGSKPFLPNVLSSSCDSMQVLVGPEGDFCREEVLLALSHGFLPVSLGKSRLRTETAALVAVHLMQLASQQN